jgi:hypothetical protein
MQSIVNLSLRKDEPWLSDRSWPFHFACRNVDQEAWANLVFEGMGALSAVAIGPLLVENGSHLHPNPRDRVTNAVATRSSLVDNRSHLYSIPYHQMSDLNDANRCAPVLPIWS